MERAKKQRRGHTFSKKLTLARQAEQQAIQLATEVEILTDWMNSDVLALVGPPWRERLELFDFRRGGAHRERIKLSSSDSPCPHSSL